MRVAPVRILNTVKLNNKNNFKGVYYSNDPYSTEQRRLQAQYRDGNIYLDQRELDRFANSLGDYRADYITCNSLSDVLQKYSYSLMTAIVKYDDNFDFYEAHRTYDLRKYGFGSGRELDPFDPYKGPKPSELYPPRLKKVITDASEIFEQRINRGKQLRLERDKELQLEAKIKDLNKLIETLPDKYDIYDINNWNSILDEIEKFDTDFHTGVIAYALENLPDIFLTEDNKAEYQNVLDRLSKIDGEWEQKDKSTGMTLAHRAAMAENPLLIKFANEKGINFGEKDNYGKTAFDYLKEYDSPDVRKELKDYKINYHGLTDFAQKGMASVLKLALGYPYVSVNSVDADGNNLGMIAAKNGNANIIRVLNSYKYFDINYKHPGIGDIINTPLNDDNETIGFFAADNGITLGNIDQFEKIMDLLTKNNYDFSVKNRMGQTFYDKAVDAENSVIIDYIDNLIDKK